MRFIDRLPEGLSGKAKWQVAAPEGGIKSIIDDLLDGRVESIDLTVQRDDVYAMIRVHPSPEFGVAPDQMGRKNTYHIGGALVEFLDMDGEPKGSFLGAYIVVQTEEVPVDMSAGHVGMWPINWDGRIATAS